MASLVRTQGDRVVGMELHQLHRPDPRTLVRSGTAQRIGTGARDAGADLLVVDAELTRSQARNLEDAAGLPVADREGVILNVFERHATTPRARAPRQDVRPPSTEFCLTRFAGAVARTR
jgi:GTP-binding protein HflX